MIHPMYEIKCPRNPRKGKKVKVDIQITVQAEDSETAAAIMKEIRKSVHRMRRLTESPIAGKRIGFTVKSKWEE